MAIRQHQQVRGRREDVKSVIYLVPFSHLCLLFVATGFLLPSLHRQGRWILSPQPMQRGCLGLPQLMFQSDTENPFLISKAPDSKDSSLPVRCLTSQALLYNWVQGVPGYEITQGLPQGPVAGIAKEQFTKKEDSG